MKCDICGEEEDELQTFTLVNPPEQLKLCKKDYDLMQKNNRLTGKLVPKRCQSCKSIIGWEWIPYKAPGRKRGAAKGNAKLDEFFDMRSNLERRLTSRPRKKKGGEEVASEPEHDVPAEEGQGIQPDVPSDAPPAQ